MENYEDQIKELQEFNYCLQHELNELAKNKRKVESEIQFLHKQIIDLFPDAVSVNIFVNSEEIEVKPTFKTDLKYTSMRKIDGNWASKSE